NAGRNLDINTRGPRDAIGGAPSVVKWLHDSKRPKRDWRSSISRRPICEIGRAYEGRTERTNDGLRNICDRRQHRGHGQHTHRVRKIAQAKVNELLSLMKTPSADRFPTGKPGKPYFTAAFRLSLERFNDQFRTVSNHRL